MFHLIFLIIIIFSKSTAEIYKFNYNPLSEQHIIKINQIQSTWKAGENFKENEWERIKSITSGVIKLPTGIHTTSYLHQRQIISMKPMPDYFDARITWPKCKSIKQISDQSQCGSCWAHSAASTMSDRICIHSNQTITDLYVSAEDLLSCCWQCGRGCYGGSIPRAWIYWKKFGIVTGGLFNSSQGCKDYSLPPCEHHIKNTNNKRKQCESLFLSTPSCKRQCFNTSLNYEKSLTFGGDVLQFLDEKEIQMEIFLNGPVEGAIEVYDDFFNYKSGVYQRTSDNYIGGHAVKILGWGNEDGVPYWLCANSWNTDWGDGGYFKILRGMNHCDVESQIFASKPIMSSSLQ